MALQQTIATKFGYDANYIWVKSAEIVRSDGNHLYITAVLFKDKATRDLSEANYIDAFRATYKISDVERLRNVFALAYTKLKSSIEAEKSSEIDKEGNPVVVIEETNKVRFSHSGDVGFQGALDV